MSSTNKRNLHYFESPTMRELYKCMDDWQEKNGKRLLSVSINKDEDIFCCIALTNPTEVVLTDKNGNPLNIYGGNLGVAG